MGRFPRINVKREALCQCLDRNLKETYEMSMVWVPNRMSNFFLQFACTSMCRHIHNWNISECDVKQLIHSTLLCKSNTVISTCTLQGLTAIQTRGLYSWYRITGSLWLTRGIERNTRPFYGMFSLVTTVKIFMPPFEKGGAYCFAHVGLSVCMSVSLNLVQLITQERFAPQASNLVGR